MFKVLCNTSKRASNSFYLSQAYNVDLDFPRHTDGGRLDDISERGSGVNECGGRSVHGGVQRRICVPVKSGGSVWVGSGD